jgi:hypothetical protein
VLVHVEELPVCRNWVLSRCSYRFAWQWGSFRYKSLCSVEWNWGCEAWWVFMVLLCCALPCRIVQNCVYVYSAALQDVRNKRETEWRCLYSQWNGSTSNSGAVSATRPADARLIMGNWPLSVWKGNMCPSVVENGCHCDVRRMGTLTRVVLLVNFALRVGVTFNLLKPTLAWCTNRFNIQEFYILPHCICVFCIYLRINSDFCPIQHKLIGFYNRDEKCLLRGTNWVLK